MGAYDRLSARWLADAAGALWLKVGSGRFGGLDCASAAAVNGSSETIAKRIRGIPPLIGALA